MPFNNSPPPRAETDVASVTKAKLVEGFAQKTKISVQRAEFVINAIFACMGQSLRRGERIELRGFGTFQVRSYKGYEGRNPKTGGAIQVPPKRMPFFKVSKNLAVSIDGGREKIRGREDAGARLIAAGVESRTSVGAE